MGSLYSNRTVTKTTFSPEAIGCQMENPVPGVEYFPQAFGQGCQEEPPKY